MKSGAILRRAQLRFHSRHPWHLVLTIIGLVLGVAVVVAIDIAIESSRQSFLHAAKTLSGDATHSIQAPSDGLAEELFTRIRLQASIRASAPVVSGRVSVPGYENKLRILGIDRYSEAGFRSYLLPQNNSVSTATVSAAQMSGLISASTAQSLNIKQGDSLLVSHNGRQFRVQISDFIGSNEKLKNLGLRDMLVMDIVDAQVLLDMVGKLSRIDLRLRELTQIDQVTSLLPPTAQLQSRDEAGKVMQQMTRAFHLNLTALSFLALLVGFFIIYNAMTFSVVQRYQLFGTLRAIGVSRQQIFLAVMLEALLLGLLATLGGILAGTVLARSLLFLVARTTTDLYVNLTDYALFIGLDTINKGLLLGVLGCLLVTCIPAWEAMKVPPRQLFEKMRWQWRTWKDSLLLVWLGAATLVFAWYLMNQAQGGLVMAFVALFLLVLGYALMLPHSVRLAAYVLRPFTAYLFGATGSMAVSTNVRSLRRTGVAMASLVIAVATAIGVSIMVDSFRYSLLEWLDYRLQADVYVNLSERGPGGSLSPELWANLKAHPQVKTVGRSLLVPVQSTVGEIDAVVVESWPGLSRAYQLIEKSHATPWQAFAQGEAVFVSESLANHNKLFPGSVIELETAAGQIPFTVMGVFRDYGSDRGRLLIHRQVYQSYWQDDRFSTYLVFLKDKELLPQVMPQLRQQLEEQGLEVYANREIRQLSVEVFERTFTVTNVLHTLALMVAFIGIVTSLMALQLERTRELAVLRAVGFTPAQLGTLLTLENTLLGGIGGVFAMPLGLVLAYGLISVINVRAFGWSMNMDIDPSILATAWFTALAAALLAGIYPTWSALSRPPVVGLRGS